jgi:hypothetical protein
MDPTGDEDVPELSELSNAISHFQNGMANLWRRFKAIETSDPQRKTVRHSGSDDSDS